MATPMQNVKSTSASKWKSYVGNELVIHLQENNSKVRVVGNKCEIKIGVNNGTLKMIGKYGRVHVENGCGRITYIGSNGRIRLGFHVDSAKVKYIGYAGKIVRDVTHLNGNNVRRIPTTTVPKRDKMQKCQKCSRK